MRRGAPTRADLQREISRGVRQALDSDGIRSDIAMVLREIDAGGTMLRAAVEAGQEELQREVLAAVEAVSAEFGEMEFMLADLARAARETQDCLHRRRCELRAAGGQAGRQSADVGLIREELAVIERRARQYLTGPADPDGPAPRWTGGCPYRGLLPYDQAHEPVFFGRERLTAELAGLLAETGIVMVIGARGAGKTSLLQAGLLPALSRGVHLPGSAAWPQVSMIPAAQPLTELAARLASLGGQDAAAIRRSLADAPGQAHLLIRDLMLSAPGRAPGPAGRESRRLILIIDQFEQVFAASEPERAAFIQAVCAAAEPAGPVLTVIAVSGDCWDRCAGYPGLLRLMRHNQFIVGPMTSEGLRRVITGPARASGLRMDPVLPDAILADLGAVGPEPGVLPMLSQALLLTWEKREGDRLTLSGYQAAGLPGRIPPGQVPPGQVAAEAVYGGSPEGSTAIARPMLWRRTLAAAVAVLVLAALAGTFLAARSARNTVSQQRIADLSGRLAAQSTALDGVDPVTASLLARAAWRIAPTAQARYSLLQSLAQPVRGILAAGSGVVTALAYGPGGKLAAGYSDKRIRLWDLNSHRVLSTAAWRATPLALAFTGGGKTLEVAAPGAVGTWNLADRTTIGVRPLPGTVEGAAVGFCSPDGSMLATGGGDGNVRRWDPATQHETGRADELQPQAGRTR